RSERRAGGGPVAAARAADPVRDAHAYPQADGGGAVNREAIQLYVMGNYDGDIAALEQAIADDPALQQMLAEEAHLEELMRGAAAAATFCPACDDLVRGNRCDSCGAAVK